MSTKSGFYAWKKKSERKRRDAQLAATVIGDRSSEARPRSTAPRRELTWALASLSVRMLTLTIVPVSFVESAERIAGAAIGELNAAAILLRVAPGNVIASARVFGRTLCVA